MSSLLEVFLMDWKVTKHKWIHTKGDVMNALILKKTSTDAFIFLDTRKHLQDVNA